MSIIKREHIYDEYTYIIHDNGTTPFEIYLSDEIIEIFNYYTRDLLKNIYDFEGYFEGESINECDGLGNSILIKINKNEYIEIGESIFSFNTDDEILKYYSPIGVSDVPYPIAYGENNIYFMLEKEYVLKKYMIREITQENCFEIYYDFYYHKPKFPRTKFINLNEIHARIW